MKLHLESHSMKIKTVSPIFIGSGGMEVNKKEYIYVMKGHKVYFIDFPKWTAWLHEKGLMDEYQSFMLEGGYDLYRWLKAKGIREKEYKSFTAYSIYAGDAIVPGHSLKGIQTFVKDCRGMPFIPGSSLKGAIRTAMAAKIASHENGGYSNEVKSIKLASRGNGRGKWYLQRECDQLESKIFNRLGINEKRPSDAVNDIMRCIQVSDSIPVDPKNLTLCGKIDVKKQNVQKVLPIYRECIKPGVEIKASITLDSLKLEKYNIGIDFIKDALEEFRQMYCSKFADAFSAPKNSSEMKFGGLPLVLGGGAGFASKTLAYPIMSKDEAVDMVSEILSRQFPKHRHHHDKRQGVSPHTIKYTKHEGKLHQIGWCDVEFNKILGK